MARREYDNYQTPDWVTSALLSRHGLPGSMVLEPCAGSGAIIRALQAYTDRVHVTAVEIREEERERLSPLTTEVNIADFLKWRPTASWAAIISNPPYSIAQQIVERALEIANGEAQVIMLLRLSFLESAKRYEFWRRHPLSRLYVLSNRPSFTEGGTDSTGSAWFVWNAGADQRIEWLRKEAV